MNVRRTVAALTSAAALSVTGVAMATPASAAPVFTGGVLNVTIVDAVDISRVTVQVPLAIAANVCDTEVSLIDIDNDGQTDDWACTATANSRARR